MRKLLLLTLLLFPLCSCSTANLVYWGMEEESIYCETTDEYSRSLLKPFVTVVGFPVALAWDIAFFPFQLLMDVYPYGERRFMNPDSGLDI
ncbi:MAG: hypothetical protein ACYTG5_07525 [Planctomycetota bacterium]